jgi:hypothetical protein
MADFDKPVVVIGGLVHGLFDDSVSFKGGYSTSNQIRGYLCMANLLINVRLFNGAVPNVLTTNVSR